MELEGKDTREIIKIMQQEIRRLDGDIAVIQHEHGKKLDMLFEAVTENEEKNKEIQERFKNRKNFRKTCKSNLLFRKKS